ncbi:MAG: ABC transporter permease [Oscillospiraceae bacterium]|nr:ABC transporter permease [Oscillospiraceae bacterium]
MDKTKNKLVLFGEEFWKYRDLLRLLVTRNLKLKYRRSFLGYVWSVLNPLLIMCVMTVVFSTMFSRNIENFPVYLFCGQLLFNYMNNSTHQAISSITGNSALLKKTYVPKYIFTLAKITSCLMDMIFSFGALLIVMLVTRASFSWHFLLFPLVILQLYLFCVGLGLFLSQANVFFRDIGFIYNAVTTAWSYLTPIFYPLEALPEWLIWCVTHLNPMYFYVAQFRDLVYSCTLPDPSMVLAGCGAALVMLAVGIWSFIRSQDKFILYI